MSFSNALCALIIIIILYLYKSLKRPHNYPPGPQWWPYFGNTYQLRNLSKALNGQHAAFEKWSKQFKTNVLGIKLGNQLVVVARSYPLLKEIHTNDEYQGRPDNFFMRLRTMGTRLGITSTDGMFWSEQRSFCMRHLREVGYGRAEMDTHIENECNDIVETIMDFNEKEIRPGSFLAPSVLNVLWALVAGKRLEKNDQKLNQILELLDQRSKAFDLCGGVMSQLPWLRYIAPESIGYNLICSLNQKLRSFIMDVVEEHKKTYAEYNSNDDFIYAYIKEMKSNEHIKNTNFTEIQLIMIILDIFIAGVTTSKITLDLALMMMVVRPDLQDAIRDELNKNDKNSALPFSEAFLFEIHRYFNFVPLTGPRRVLNDTKLDGYDIPKNTTVLLGLRSVMMNKELWKDPENFRPERFLDEKMNIIKFEYFTPFGQGKRRCLGDALAKSCIKTFFTGIVKNFKIILPEGHNVPSTDLMPGVFLSPKPYKVKFCRI